MSLVGRRSKIFGGFSRQAPIIGSRTKHDQPLGLLHTVAVGLGVPKRLPLGALGLGNLVAGTVADEDGLASPLDDDLRDGSTTDAPDEHTRHTYVLALGDGLEVDLNLSLSQDIGGGRHVDKEV